MNKKLMAAALMGTMLATSAMADEQPRIGVGVGLSNTSSTVRVPIDIAKDLRIEPELGIGYSKADKVDNTSLLIGTGLYVMQQPSSKINLYFGGKLGVDYKSTKVQGKHESNTNFYLGGAFGFEYMFERHFSAGGEAGVYLGFGDSTTFNTQGLALLRYYF